MGRELGRISGPLLADNLLRNGVDLAFETDLLYLDVINGRIGVRNSAPSYTLSVNSAVKSPTLIVDQQSSIGDFTISTNNIQYLLGAIYVSPNQSSDPSVLTTKFATANLEISNQLIKNITSNSDINLSPIGTGKTTFNTTQVNVNGALHATGDITWDGTITFGDSNTDSVTFNSDIASNITPDLTGTYNLGSVSNRWAHIYSANLDTSSFESSSLIVNGINLVYSPANTYFVSVNGNDSNVGTHQRATFRTIKHALSMASAGYTICIYPGTYTEDFPLTVPAGVTVTGMGLRSVSVQPSAGTDDLDGFLLNGETTVENVTVQNFYYNATNNTGYAFRFANGAKVTTRSPYLRNVTVITATGAKPAGAGALADGAVCDPATYEAALLFHAATFIVPGATGVMATNGARVEWLNSFTYYAYRGIYLTRGTLGLAGLGVKYGAELRSINSANVYGTYGAVADGANTLGYLIGHNFAYIGTGVNNLNDPKDVIQANEVIQLNSGVIYWESVDHHGDFRIGDIFYVQQSTGLVSFNSQSFNLGSGGSLSLNGPTSSTYIDKNGIQTGNIWIHGNNIDSVLGPVNFSAFSGKTYLNTNVFVTGNTNISADVVVDGNLYLGDQPTDTITITPNLTQDILPDATNTLTLGTDTKRWQDLFNKLLDIDGVTQITNNTITTLSGNTNLQFNAAGTGQIKIPSSDVSFGQNLTIGSNFTVNGVTNLQSVGITGNILLTGDINQTGTTYITGTFNTSTAQILGNSYLQGHFVKFFGNEISISNADTDLGFYANGTGGVIIDNSLKFTNNEISNVWSSASTDVQKGIEFTPNGTGDVLINSTKAIVFPLGNTSTRLLSAPGEVRYNTNSNMFEGYVPTGRVNFNNVWDTDRNTYITAELTPGTNDNTFRFGIDGTVKATLDGNKFYSNANYFGNISVIGNTISSLNSSDISITTPGAAVLNINSLHFAGNNITNTQNSALILQNTGSGYVKFGGTSAMVIPYGTTDQRRLAPEIGEIRNNSTLGYMEVFNGTQWIPAIGTSGAVTLEDVELAMDIWSLVLG